MVSFISILLKVLNIAEFRLKVDIVLAIGKLHKEEGIPNATTVQTVLLTILSDSDDTPSCLNQYQKAFIIEALTLMQSMGLYDRFFYTELMVQFLEADTHVRYVA